jgi:heterodisulfide reductase subunit A
VLTHLELDQRFLDDDRSLNDVRTAVFIQCVGSREPGRPYCSRVCCTHTMESALELKRRNPAMEVCILYRDLRTYGEREALYHEAREKGVLFFRYGRENKPTVTTGGNALEVRMLETVLDSPIRIEADLLILATAIVPPDNDTLAKFFKIPLDENGFFIEAHAKLRPVEFATDGLFLCGMAHYPKSLDESIAQAMAAASRAATLLAKGKVAVSGTVAETVTSRCTGCGVCVGICPYKAPAFNDEDKVSINAALCKGCGLCVASCRSGAIYLKGYDDAQVLAMINEM